MKSIKYFAFVILAVLALSACSKHKITYDTVPVTENDAEFQMFNDLATRSGEAATLTTLQCVVLNNNDTIAWDSYPLNGRNAIPSGSTTRFFVRKPGTYEISAWKSYEDAKAGLEPNYVGTFVLTAGKQMVHIYNWHADPVVMDDDYPYIRADRPNSVEYIYYNILNLWQEINSGLSYSAWLATKDPNGTGTPDHTQVSPSVQHLQYYIRFNKAYTDEYGPAGRTEWQPVGDPVGFGQGTGFCPIVVPNKGRGYTGGPSTTDLSAITAGYIQIYTKIEIAETGTVIQTEDYWGSQYCGRFYIHTIYPKDRPTNQVYIFQFTAL